MTNPTQKKLKIAKEISKQLEGIVNGTMLGGSMQYGQNYSVTEKSDVDMVVVININKINLINSLKYFKGRIPAHVEKMFKNKKINSFWVTKNVGGVEVNNFFYETKDYTDFCLLKGMGLKEYISTQPKNTQKSLGFTGEVLEFNRNVRGLREGGYLYEKPIWVNGKFWGGAPKIDFMYPLKILYEKDKFFTNLDEKVWKAFTEQLVKEQGKNVNLSKASILHSNWIYQNRQEKLPSKMIKYIKDRTKKELKKYLEKI
ncbi:hypothetical protein KAT24_00880 [Candidatus Pacearchaeota archaeon]|nr:hypothetical protein [Candidatus Pacearchaeota archaeon]